MSTPIPEEKIAELSALIFQRRKIEAIKIYRDLTGLGLKESKDAVEELEASLQKASPEKFSPESKGCLGAAALVCVGFAALIYWTVRG